MKNNGKTAVIIQAILIVILVGSVVYLSITYETPEAKAEIKGLEDKIEVLEVELLNQPTYNQLEITIENLQNESQELTKIISDIINVCNDASTDSYKKQNDILEKENAILQTMLEKLRGA